MADALLQVVLDNLNSMIQREIGLLWGVDEEMEKLSSTLSTIRAVLEDAELRQLQDRAIKIWLRKLKQATYHIDDVLDECATEAVRLKESKRQTLDKVRGCFLSCYSPVDNVLFRHKVGNKMKEINEKLNAIAEERSKFHLHEVVVANRVGIPEWRETSSLVTETQLYGREIDKEFIVSVLVKLVSECQDVSVLPILGIGGLGKTTLAQLVFNDERVIEHFELRIWVCVSEDFEIKRVIKSILASVSGKSCEDLELDHLQRQLHDKLNGKRYLLVLDDVWNDNQEKWNKLKCVLAFGSRGASVVITTRLENVASIMGTLPPYCLLGLTEDDCWSLFKQRAFRHEGEKRPDLEEIGKEIVKKCGGVPLAANALGSLLRFKNEKSEWLHVKDSEIWSLQQDEKCSIMPALRLSYHNLPLECRQCFAYCATYEKDSRIEKDRIIHLWMATGCISSNGTMELEDIGNKIWNELHWRSFFQEVENDKFGNIESFKMHDLVHDLAQSIMEDECHMMKVERPKNMPNKSTRHLISVHDSKVLENVESLRTLFVNMFSPNVMKFSTLRVLDASGTCISELPSSIGNLIHLRYLNLSNNGFIALPNTICNLLNLQTLNLEWCESLERLPKYMRRLTNLRHLFLEGCYKLTQVAPKIGQLTNLKTLSRFIVDGRTGFRLGELRGLNLGGKLRIDCLERVENWMDAREANLIEKQNIYSLILYWTFEVESESSLAENAERVLDALEPHPNIKELKIISYPGTSFPLWMREPVLENLVTVQLFDCDNCQNLPPFGRLRFLKELRIGWMKDVKYIDNDDSGHGGAAGMKFPSLERLGIIELPSLERLSREEEKDVVVFPRLSFLVIKDCPQLTLPCLSSLNLLRAWGCSDVLLNSISNLTRLTDLEIQRNHQQLSYLEGSLQNLTALNSLQIYGCREQGLQRLQSFGLRGITESVGRMTESLSEANQSLNALNVRGKSVLESLSEGCPKLVSPPEDCINCKHLHSLRRLQFSDNLDLVDLPEALQHVPALQSLEIINNKELTSLPEWLGNLASLQQLSIWRCPKVDSLPDTIQSLTNLTTLVISGCCEQLKRRCEKGCGEDWHKIARIPYVRINE
ncbi:putative disease resistance protein RGA3 [Cornus florida]|uniref:putative disease resistance protein RGA3 n=1 Tax=Cornus florida TaxID=4283 RepID=UPI0028A0CC1D|nr:putative disease resistance protein RGA3 [Cornus florida]XP_059657152.1 putative disease resistance protein RGA3 [Cornus florida]XP_059657153.1 putative disease resistance protein RGA3 [Cornus florida]XP_059657154.1 putative disease resistance protein RGA3 [Cornus florida]XP_059657155.1 putative disease resistance protein RGA3 [Cornus florida]XP_059657157.1 putative disease resistance protein RGA3 [Cornus florida]XP_059657158.1 putative disease resistance protein RGA3 [Cornus florida]